MSGRVIFDKYEKQIKFLIIITKMLPLRMRKWLLNRNRYRSSIFGMLNRYLLVSSLAKKIGKNVSIFPGVYFEYIENLSIGDNVSIHQMCYIDAEGGIEIGDDVSIAHRSTILSSNHSYDKNDVPIKYQEMKLQKTIIKSNVWVGCNVVILAGAVIGTGCVIGANSTVTKSIAPDSVAVGSPVKIIKQRNKIDW